MPGGGRAAGKTPLPAVKPPWFLADVPIEIDALGINQGDRLLELERVEVTCGRIGLLATLGRQLLTTAGAALVKHGYVLRLLDRAI